MHYWHGKTAIITGASSGIGASTARFLASNGMQIILVARRVDRMEAIRDSLARSGAKAEIFPADLTIESDRENLFSQINEKYGSPAVLVNNAGVGWYGYYSEMPWGVSQDILKLNIEATAHLTHLFLPGMLELERARIINIGSIAGKLPEQGIAIYSASKSFMDSFSSVLYREYRYSSVRISVIRAGSVKTEFFEQARKLPNGGNIPAESMAVSPEKVAEAVWHAIIRPRRVLYVPWYLRVSPLLESFFSPVIDSVGPLLLNRHKH